MRRLGGEARRSAGRQLARDLGICDVRSWTGLKEEKACRGERPCGVSGVEGLRASLPVFGERRAHFRKLSDVALHEIHG